MGRGLAPAADLAITRYKLSVPMAHVGNAFMHSLCRGEIRCLAERVNPFPTPSIDTIRRGEHRSSAFYPTVSAFIGLQLPQPCGKMRQKEALNGIV